MRSGKVNGEPRMDIFSFFTTAVLNTPIFIALLLFLANWF
jgi:hypothetical protein